LQRPSRPQPFLPRPLKLALFIASIAFTSLQSSAADAGTAPISHISKKNTVVINAGSIQGLSVGDQVCFVLPIRKIRSCAVVKRVKRSFAAVRVDPEVAAELKVGILAEFVPTKPGIGGPEQQNLDSTGRAEETEALADDQDNGSEQNDSQEGDVDQKPHATLLPPHTALGIDLGVGLERLADNVSPASFNATAPVISARATGRLFFGAESTWSVRSEVAVRSFKVALAQQSTDSSQADSSSTRTFNESDVRLAVAKDLLGSTKHQLELGLGGVYKRLPAALSVSSSGTPNPGLLPLGGPLALLSYTRHLGPHDLNAALTLIPRLVGKKASGQALAVGSTFHQSLTPEWQLSYAATYEQWRGRNSARCPTVDCNPSSSFKDTSMEVALGLLRWF